MSMDSGDTSEQFLGMHCFCRSGSGGCSALTSDAAGGVAGHGHPCYFRMLRRCRAWEGEQMRLFYAGAAVL